MSKTQKGAHRLMIAPEPLISHHQQQKEHEQGVVQGIYNQSEKSQDQIAVEAKTEMRYLRKQNRAIKKKRHDTLLRNDVRLTQQSNRLEMLEINNLTEWKVVKIFWWNVMCIITVVSITYEILKAFGKVL